MTPFYTKIPPKENWWQHYCHVQQDIMSFEKGVECDWCGMTEETIKKNKETIDRMKQYEEWRNDERKTD